MAVSTTVLLDRERTLRFDFDALDRLSDLALAQRSNRSPLELWGDANGMDINAMAMMVWAGTRHEDKGNEFTLDRARTAVRRALQQKRITYRQLNEALNAAINQSDIVGLM